MSDDRLREIEERVAKATQGPWFSEGLGGIQMDGVRDGYLIRTYKLRLAQILSPRPTRKYDAELIAHAREDIPWLLQQLREAREENERLGEGRDKMRDTAKVNYDVLERLRKENEGLKTSLTALVDALDLLMVSSEGVAGLHRNGDLATWSELTRGGEFHSWLESWDEAWDLLRHQKHDGNSRAALGDRP